MVLDKTTTQTVLVLSGLFLPALVRYVVDSPHIPLSQKYLIAFISSLVIGITATLATSGWTLHYLLANLAIVLAAQQLAYEVYWKHALPPEGGG